MTGGSGSDDSSGSVDLNDLQEGIARNTVVNPDGSAMSAYGNYTGYRNPDGSSSFTGPEGSYVTDAYGNTSFIPAQSGFFQSIGNGVSNAANDISDSISNIGNSISNTTSNVFSSASDWLANTFAGGSYAEGGYSGQAVAHSLLPATAWANAPHYADGTENTSGGMPSILHPDEAVIPLSRGRKIPVDLGPNGQNGGQSPLNVTIHVTTTDADSFMRSQGQIASKVGMALQRAQGRNG